MATENKEKVLFESNGRRWRQSITKNNYQQAVTQQPDSHFLGVSGHTLHKGIQPQLYRCIGGLCNAFDSTPVKVGGYYDHVHILCRLSRKIAVMKLLEEVKKGSSKWMKTTGSEYNNFHWQDGYGAFSVNPTEIDVVVDYIENQDVHHSHKTFQEEFQAFLKKYTVDYDERYVWD